MTDQAVRIFPQDGRRVEDLVERHRELDTEPLVLAVRFESLRFPNDIALFEVAENFGAGLVSLDGDLFETTYSSSKKFPLERGQKLRLVITNPTELDAALDHRWPRIEEIRNALRSGRAEVVWYDGDRGRQILDRLGA